MEVISPVILEVIQYLEAVKLAVFMSRIYNRSLWENKKI